MTANPFAIAVGAVVAAVMVGSGVYMIVPPTGPRAQATVRHCDVTVGRGVRVTHCTGTWIEGGSLRDGGHVVIGTIEGVDADTVGQTIEVTLARGAAYARKTAYPRTLIIPFTLLGLGLVVALTVLRALTPQPSR